VAAWDATSDLALPVVDAVLFDTVADPWRPIPLARGQGCHPARSVAFLRAVTEAAQDRLTLIAGSRDDTGYEAYGGAADRLLREWADSLADEPTPTPFDALPDRTNETVAEDVVLVLEHLARAGLDQVAVVDLTHPDLGVAVWRTVVPGLEYMGSNPAAYRPGARATAVLATEEPGSFLP
jgi:ribosomal protein S12 methylthiotransferase accessory factor